jgi:hypothetical protein
MPSRAPGWGLSFTGEVDSAWTRSASAGVAENAQSRSCLQERACAGPAHASQAGRFRFASWAAREDPWERIPARADPHVQEL